MWGNCNFYDATFSDNRSGLQNNLTGGLPSRSLFPIGLTTVVYTATDVGGNETSCQIPIVVNDVELQHLLDVQMILLYQHH